MTKLDENSELRREIRIPGVDAPLNLVLTAKGITLKAKGTKIGVHASWDRLLDAMETPENVPSAYFHRPRAFLIKQAAK